MKIRDVFTVFLGLTLAIAALADSESTPVVVELFTSQGCSSCPPADRFLQDLTKQPIDGVEIIPLSWHVDYWNHLGWSDPYSSEAATARQELYARKLHVRGLYTPQMIVDGQSEFVGSDRQQGMSAIASAAEPGKVALKVTVKNTEGRISATAEADTAEASWRAILALTEDEVVTDVKHGENHGRTLHQSGVVRDSVVMRLTESGEWTGSVSVPKDAKGVHAVVFIQDESGRIIAAFTESIG